MNQARLNHAMSLCVHKDRADKINLANSSRNVTERRRNYLVMFSYYSSTSWLTMCASAHVLIHKVLRDPPPPPPHCNHFPTPMQ